MSIIAWALGYAINKTRDKFVETIITKNLEEKLQGKVDAWRIKYRYNDSVSSAIFNTEVIITTEIGPAQQILARKLKEDRIPDIELWFDALKERFEAIQQYVPFIEDRQKLFQKNLQDIEGEFKELAGNLREVCIQEEKMFQGFVVQKLGELITLLENEQSVTFSLIRLADFLNNKRLLFQPFDHDWRNPILPMLRSAGEVREYLDENIIQKLKQDDIRYLVNQMIEVCRNFIDRIEKLPLKLRRDDFTAINELDKDQQELIENATLYLRMEFTKPLISLLTNYGVNLPKNILRQTNLTQLGVAGQIYFNSLSIDSRKPIIFAGYEEVGYFLRIATLADSQDLQGVKWPAGTELIFYKPEAKNLNQIVEAIPGADILIAGQLYKKNRPIYFDIDGNVVEKFPA